MGKETTSVSILSAATHGAELTGAVFMYIARWQI